MARYLHPDEGFCYACPQCDYAPVYQRRLDGDYIQNGKGDEFRCNSCGETFGEPVERRNRCNGPLTDLEKRIESGEVDPEAVLERLSQS